MPPKIKITKDQILQTAMDMVKESGVSVLNARTLATRLGCSTQPIFSNYTSMDELKEALLLRSERCYQEYIQKEMATNQYPEYKAMGMAYIRFAAEEKELFKLLFMRNRSDENIHASSTLLDLGVSSVKNHLPFSEEHAFLFHLEMWVFVHGIASMLATSYLPWNTDTISSMITDIYQGLKAHYISKEEPS